MKDTALLIQSLTGFEPFLTGMFQQLQEADLAPAAISTGGASIPPSVWFSAGYPMDDYLAEIKKIHRFATPPSMVFSGSYSNGFFHSTSAFDLMRQITWGDGSSMFTCHYTPDLDQDEKMQQAMQIPVYSGIIDLQSGQSQTVNMQEFSAGKHHRWLTGRIPFFSPASQDGKTCIEDYYRNPPIKPLIKNKKIKKLVVIRLSNQKDHIPATMLELQSRDMEFTMDAVFEREMGFLENVNQWVAEGKLPKTEYRVIQKHIFYVQPEALDHLDYTGPGITRKYQAGQQKAQEIMEAIHK